ncbi:MAG: mucoidy inhibitor MuiA family protein [Candidatus Thorarchaeota archaeon]|nr:MAG: mucoidy inhibitor MuiA family protein [Candidatus Thorarchaeota archaeon]
MIQGDRDAVSTFNFHKTIHINPSTNIAPSKSKYAQVHAFDWRIVLTEVKTEITKVTIFRDGARVTRTGKVTLTQGPQKAEIHGITEYASADSFRVKGKGPAKLSSIDIQTNTEVFEPSDEVKPLHDELEELQKKLEEIQDDLDFHNGRLTNLNSMVSEFSNYYGQVYAANEGEIGQLTEMDKTASKMFLDTKKSIRSLEDKREEVTKKIEVVRQNISRIGSKRRTESFNSVEVSLELSEDSEVELEITYQVNNARWNPIYDVDLLPGNAKLRRMALLYNQTKEDWNSVDLVVSTATARPVTAVEATPYYIGVYDPSIERDRRKDSFKMKKEGRPMPSMAPAAAKSMMAPPAPPPEMEEEFAEATETVSGIAVYELPKKVTIPSDNEKHPITLIEEDLVSETIHYWYTEGMAEVVAQDKVTNGDNVILLGKVKVYAEGDYIGETSISQISPREEFKLGTRTAYDVKAEKKLTHREVEKAGITKGKLRRSYKYKLEIQSFSKRPVEIEVFDRIPHSESTSIEVKAEWDKFGVKKHHLGILEWQKSIQPNEKTLIEYEYEVSWEKGITVHPPLP